MSTGTLTLSWQKPGKARWTVSMPTERKQEPRRFEAVLQAPLWALLVIVALVTAVEVLYLLHVTEVL